MHSGTSEGPPPLGWSPLTPLHQGELDFPQREGRAPSLSWDPAKGEMGQDKPPLPCVGQSGILAKSRASNGLQPSALGLR